MLLMDLRLERIANKARKSISEFCLHECNAYCCRKGYLTFKQNSVKLISCGREEEFLANGTLVETSTGNFAFNLNIEGCPCLKDSRCSVHKSKNRPSCCQTFPFFIQGNTFFLSSRCPAVKGNLFYPFVRKLLLLGYKQG